MRGIAYKVLGFVAALTACSEPSAPTGTFEASRKSVHQITATDLGIPGGGNATDNNNRGQVVGEGNFVWAWAKGDFRGLDTLPGYDNIQAEAINASGAIVGWAVPPGQQGHAILWNRERVQNLGLLPGDVNSEAHAINASGDIVGVSRAEGGDLFNHAVLWRKGQLIALGTLPGIAQVKHSG